LERKRFQQGSRRGARLHGFDEKVFQRFLSVVFTGQQCVAAILSACGYGNRIDSMTHTILVIVLFLLSGEPQAHAATLSPGVPCDRAQAVNFSKQVETQLAASVQEEILWQCIPVQSPGPPPAPDMPPRHLPSDNEA
jgi:hypothetical protein